MGKLGKMKPPSWFTKEKYESYKRSGISDKAIREDILFVSDKVLLRWKKELKVDPIKCGKNDKKDGSELIEKIMELRKKGWSYKQIGLYVGKSTSTIGSIVHRYRRDGKVFINE